MLWHYVLDALLFIAGAVGLGYCAVILKLYVHDPRARHISALAVSWCTLAALAMMRVIQGVLVPGIEVVVLFAFGVGDYGLIWLWNQHWRQHAHLHQQPKVGCQHWSDEQEELDGPFEE